MQGFITRADNGKRDTACVDYGSIASIWLIGSLGVLAAEARTIAFGGFTVMPVA